jgi:hypothetical protein
LLLQQARLRLGVHLLAVQIVEHYYHLFVTQEVLRAAELIHQHINYHPYIVLCSVVQ